MRNSVPQAIVAAFAGLILGGAPLVAGGRLTWVGRPEGLQSRESPSPR